MKAELYKEIFKHLYSCDVPLINEDDLRYEIAVCCLEFLYRSDEPVERPDNVALVMSTAFLRSFKKFLNAIDYLPNNFEGDIVSHFKHKDEDTCLCILRPISWFTSTVENADKFSMIRMDSLTRL